MVDRSDRHPVAKHEAVAIASDVRDVLPSPVVIAPMAGGPTTPELVIAASRAGALAFLAGGYKTAAQVRDEIDSVRAATTAPFGVNIFVPGRPTIDATAVERYVAGLQGEGYEVAPPTWDDDDWSAKVTLLLEVAPPVVTFTFGSPPAELAGALSERGVSVGVTVTTASEARLAHIAGAGFLCVQGPEAGAHRGTFVNDGLPDGSPLPQLLTAVANTVPVPLLAAGGLSTRPQIDAVLSGRVVGVLCGTVFLRCHESGATQVYKDALANPVYTETVVTRAFSGRPARGLRNRFIADHADAPAAYPEINNATRPLRAAGDPEAMSLWAGTGWRQARDEPLADVLNRLRG